MTVGIFIMRLDPDEFHYEMDGNNKGRKLALEEKIDPIGYAKQHQCIFIGWPVVRVPICSSTEWEEWEQTDLKEEMKSMISDSDEEIEGSGFGAGCFQRFLGVMNVGDYVAIKIPEDTRFYLVRITERGAWKDDEYRIFCRSAAWLEGGRLFEPTEVGPRLRGAIDRFKQITLSKRHTLVWGNYGLLDAHLAP